MSGETGVSTGGFGVIDLLRVIDLIVEIISGAVLVALVARESTRAIRKEWRNLKNEWKDPT
jgi:hypothetical protein